MVKSTVVKNGPTDSLWPQIQFLVRILYRIAIGALKGEVRPGVLNRFGQICTSWRCALKSLWRMGGSTQFHKRGCEQPSQLGWWWLWFYPMRLRISGVSWVNHAAAKASLTSGLSIISRPACFGVLESIVLSNTPDRSASTITKLTH